MFAYCGNNPANAVDASGFYFNNVNMTDGPGHNPFNPLCSWRTIGGYVPEDSDCASPYVGVVEPSLSRDGLTAGVVASASRMDIPEDDGIGVLADVCKAEADIEITKKNLGGKVGVDLVDVKFTIPVFDFKIELGVELGAGVSAGLGENGFFARLALGIGFSFGVSWKKIEEKNEFWSTTK